MAFAYRRVHLIGHCILGTGLALPVAFILSRLTVRKEGFLVVLVPLAIAFTMIMNSGSERARKRDALQMREEAKKRFGEGKPPIGI
jgi:hypothetical protein